jgi:hypothetical protein
MVVRSYIVPCCAVVISIIPYCLTFAVYCCTVQLQMTWTFFSPHRYEPLTLSNVSILLKALCQCGQEGEAVKYHQKSLDLLYAPKSFIPASSTESWSSGSIGRVEKFLNSVTHGFVQHLASEHRVEDVIGVLDGVHASIEHFSSLHAQHTGAAVTGVIYYDR